jgi:signal transduction histidine kinase
MSPGCQAVSAESVSPKNTKDAAGILQLIAHELRQPLSTIDSIGCYLGLVLPPGESKARTQAAKLQGLVAQVNWILSDAIHFLQPEPPLREPTDLAELILQSRDDVSNPGDPEMRLHAPGVPALVLADGDQVRHLLRNLLRFCRQHACAGEAPEVIIHDGDDLVSLRVSVATSGLPVAEPDRLLEPFNPYLPSDSGLVLASARRIAEVNGVSLEVHTSPGILSFSVVFPRAASLERTSVVASSGT